MWTSQEPYEAKTRLEQRYHEAQTQRLLGQSWHNRWAAWLSAPAARLAFDTPPLEGGQAVKAQGLLTLKRGDYQIQDLK